MGWNWDKEAHNSWADKVTFELMEIRQRIELIEAQLKDLGTSTTTPVTTEEGEVITADRAERASIDLVKATYSIRSAAIAMRGYLMLVDQANLSKDQKKMVRELEYSMMMIMKTAQAIKILQLAYHALTAAELGPMGFFYLAVAGGYTASSLAYGSKMMGGGV